MKNIILILSFITALNGCKNTDSQNVELSEKERIINNFDVLIKDDLKEDNIDGSVSFVIVKGNEVLVSEAYGFSDGGKKIKVDTNTIFRIGSITKSFTGFLLISLSQEGILSLEDPIEKYLPEIKALIEYDNYPPITFKQLASHTSGLNRESGNREANFGVVDEWQQKVLEAIPETSFRSSPEERFGYSNIGYAILGLAIERAADQPYIELINERVLKPLEMSNTFFEITESNKVNLAKGMGGGPTTQLDYELPLKEHEGRGYRIPNGGIYSTPNDLARFMKACMGYAPILNKESLTQLQTSQTPTTRLRSNYSYGFSLYSDQGINTVGHGGSTPGYSAHFEFEKQSQYGIIILRNYNFGNTNFDLRSNALLRKLTLTE